MSELTIRIKKQNADHFALNVNVTLPSTGVTALFGHSGSGKTTLLRCIAGLEQCEHGFVQLKDQIWQDDNRSLATHHRPIGYVFQEASLFPHLTAYQNLQFAMKRADKSRRVISYDEVIQLMGLAPLLKQYPHQLSGGERQRVAIARALLIQPQLLLMDEPLSALDDQLKQDILPYLEALCARTQIPILYISHSIEEVIRLANHLVVLEKGKVIEQGETQNVLGKLSTSMTRLQEASVLIAGEITELDTEWGLACLSFGQHIMTIKQGKAQVGDHVRLRVQAKDVSISLDSEDRSSILNRLNVVVDDLALDEQDNSMMMVRLLADDTPILARLTAYSAHKLNLHKGQLVIAQIKSVAVLR